MPAVHAKPGLRPVETIRFYQLVNAEVIGAVGRVPLPGNVEVPGTAEVVFRARAADGGVGLTVQEELDLPLAPPARPIYTYGHIGADVATAARSAFQDRMDLPGSHGV